jgi:ATP-dependent Lon protease
MNEAVSFDIKSALGDAPIFPLPDSVLFPGGLLPLHVFEPRYRAMLRYCMDTHGGMVVARIADPNDRDASGEPRFASVAGLGEIVSHEPLADGRANIVLIGRARVRLEERPQEGPFRRARAYPLVDVGDPVSDFDYAGLIGTAMAYMTELRRHTKFAFEMPSLSAPGAFADLCANYLLPDASVRQSLLEERDVGVRVRRAAEELAKELGILQRPEQRRRH